MSFETHVSSYASLRSGSVVVVRKSGIAAVSGVDRVAWLQGMVSNDIARLNPGEGCYAAHLNARGRVVALMVILVDEDRLLLHLDQDVAAAVAALDRLLIMEDAQVTDGSNDFSVLTLVGSGSARLLSDAFDLDGPGGLPREMYGHTSAGGVRLVKSELGYDVIVPTDTDARILDLLEGSGATVESGEALWNLLSIEAGLPRYGLDVDETTTLPELGEKGIDYTKGCYIGQEVVAKIKYLGHVNRSLVGLRGVEPGAAPEWPPGALLFKDDREVGRLTRSAKSPALDAVIGLGYLRRGFDNAGTLVDVRVDDDHFAAVVVGLPFVEQSF